jgi:hypothetical protein
MLGLSHDFYLVNYFCLIRVLTAPINAVFLDLGACWDSETFLGGTKNMGPFKTWWPIFILTLSTLVGSFPVRLNAIEQQVGSAVVSFLKAIFA